MSAVSTVLPLVPQELRFMGESDEAFWRLSDLLAEQVGPWLPHGARVLDFGCGYGRLAYGLARQGFAGHYLGVDVLDRHIKWLDRHFRAEAGDHYRFARVDLKNDRYNPSGKRPEQVDFGVEPASQDCVAAVSVFTHMPEDDVTDYLQRLAKWLRPGGVLVASFYRLRPNFSLRQQPARCAYPMMTQVTAHGFAHKAAEPLLVAAYEQEFLMRAFEEADLELVRDIPGAWYAGETTESWQDWFVLRRRERALVGGPVVGQVRPKKISPEYDGGIKRLNVGCGPLHIWQDWWNVDIREFEGIDECKDVTQPWTWRNLELIFAEHFLQALAMEDALKFFTHAGRALRVGGVMRLSTPNLRWVVLTHLRPLETDRRRSVEGTLSINRAFHGWGHKFLWTDAMLAEVLESMGFEDVKFHAYGQSKVPALSGRESHGNHADAFGQPSVVIVECRRGNRPIGIGPALAKRLDEDLIRYVKWGH